MRPLLFLLRKEFQQIMSNPSILVMIMLMPVLQLLVMPLAANFDINNINIAVVNHDRSERARQLVDKIASSGYFRLVDYGSSFNAAYTRFEGDKSDLILEIPHGFDRNLMREGRSDLLVAVNAINGVKASVGSSYLARIIVEFDAEAQLRQAIRGEAVASLPGPVIEPVSINRFNPSLSYPPFMVPGLMVLLVTMVGVYMCSLNIVKEKETGTIEQINVTPIKKYHFILGKLIPFLLIGIVVFTISMLASFPVYHIRVEGSLWTLYAFLVLYLVAMLGIGLVISTYSSTQQQAMSLAFFCIMIFSLMGGLFTPLDSMPEWSRTIARLNPASYFIEVVRLIMLKGSRFSDVQDHFLIIAGFAVFFNTWAALNYKKTSE